MIIFFKKNSIGGYSTPVALVDYTRSDDQFSTAQIQKWVAQTGGLLNLIVNIADLSIFSLDYSALFHHSAVNLADSLKTNVRITVSNAPPELVSLVQVKQIVGQETALSLTNSIAMVLDPQNQFARAVMIFNVPGPLGVSQNIVRQFIVYGTTYNFDAKRINSKLEIRGADFDSVVMQLQLKFNINKKLPLVSQIRAALVGSGWIVTADEEMEALPPVIERYYPPAPLNKLLANVCRDNGIWFDLHSGDSEQAGVVKTIELKALNTIAAPLSAFPANMSFRGSAAGAYMISSFSVRDYATAVFKAEPYDAKLFDQVNIYDDSDASDLFDNFRANVAPPPTPRRGRLLFSYPFYVLEYALMFSASESSVEIRGTNNWLVSNYKLDTFFENAVYGGIP